MQIHPNTWRVLVEAIESLQTEVERVWTCLAAVVGQEAVEHLAKHHLGSWMLIQKLREMNPDTGEVE